ncbi:hypothetical protein OS493_031726 [Desmophyllum pertusum]|uniref:Uncharacterized protein n=1 Tax=Desmophyllum pertusum TaxID=174260 RepID=A0A9X0D132_9CNID|nr:hypothetical protein OS493_031726 [Desmophyllum pertusum]
MLCRGQEGEGHEVCAHVPRENKKPSCNCSAEFKKFLDCFKNFTLGKCYGDYLKNPHNMREPMERMVDMKAGFITSGGYCVESLIPARQNRAAKKHHRHAAL